MRFIPRLVFAFGIACALLSAAPLHAAAATVSAARAAEPLLSPMFGDHMVLQRGKPNTFWGWAPAGQTVRVQIGEHTAEAVAGADGRWRAAVDVPAAGGPYTVEVQGVGERRQLRDVLVGDVWLCGGQSNMLFSLRASIGGGEALKHADRETLRFYRVPNQPAYAPASTARGEWQVSSPESAASFSAVAYYFAETLQREIDVPIGLIVSAVGGSPAESWISADGLARLGEFEPHRAKIAKLHANNAPPHGSFLMHWLDENDAGAANAAWAQPEFDDRAWKPVSVPSSGAFAELGVPTDPAIVWFRREIVLPDPLPAGTAKIFLGVIERMETVYLNGQWTGASSWVENPRVYTIKPGTLRPGRNLVALRVFKRKPDGGFLSPPETLRIELGDGTTVPLAGDWQAAVSFDARPPATLPLDLNNYPTMPTVLYNGMIAPVAPLAIAGALWYQGEANREDPEQYRKLMPALIADWRATFGQGEFPFYIAGLPAFMQRSTTAGDEVDGWTRIRDAQAATVRNVRNTGLAVTIDTGDAADIHPRVKQPIGERLALLALAGHYRKNVVARGPSLRFVEPRAGALALHFDHADGGLQVRGDTLGEFAIAGADRKWHWAEARIEGDDVVVISSPEVPQPIVARYAWQANPLATLFNGAGLPAEPFRTDE